MNGGHDHGAAGGSGERPSDAQAAGRKKGGLLRVEVLSEGPHCIPCEYMIATVDYLAEEFAGRIEVEIVVTTKRQGAKRFLDLCKSHGKQVPVPSILFEGKLVFETNPGPDELRDALEAALSGPEVGK